MFITSRQYNIVYTPRLKRQSPFLYSSPSLSPAFSLSPSSTLQRQLSACLPTQSQFWSVSSPLSPAPHTLLPSHPIGLNSDDPSALVSPRLPTCVSVSNYLRTALKFSKRIARTPTRTAQHRSTISGISSPGTTRSSG